MGNAEGQKALLKNKNQFGWGGVGLGGESREVREVQLTGH